MWLQLFFREFKVLNHVPLAADEVYNYTLPSPVTLQLHVWPQNVLKSTTRPLTWQTEIDRFRVWLDLCPAETMLLDWRRDVGSVQEKTSSDWDLQDFTECPGKCCFIYMHLVYRGVSAGAVTLWDSLLGSMIIKSSSDLFSVQYLKCLMSGWLTHLIPIWHENIQMMCR